MKVMIITKLIKIKIVVEITKCCKARKLYILGSFMQVQKTVTIGYEHAHFDFVRSSHAGDRNVTSLHEFKHAL